MYKRIDSTLKQEVLEKVKNGAKVAELCAQYGLGSKTIYTWLRHQADTGTSNLEIAKLRRENQDLKEIIGALALDKKRAEKNTRHS